MWDKLHLEELVEKYQASEQEMTYSGFLYFANLTNDILSDLRADCVRGEEDAISYMRVLDKFRLSLEAYMERILIYQKKKLDYKVIGNLWSASKSRGVFDANRDMRVPIASVNVQLPKLQENESGFKIDNAITEITKRI